MADDVLFRGLLKSPAIRFAFVEASGLCAEGIRIHDADPVGGKIFAEALTVGALLTVLLEGGERYSLRFGYTGAVGTLTVETGADGAVRGIIARPHLADGPVDADALFGVGDATVAFVKAKEGKVLNSGQIHSALASPAADAGLFLSISDQIETEIITTSVFRADPAAPVKLAAGLMVQAMPGCDLGVFTQVREKLHRPEALALLADAEMPSEAKIRRLLDVAGCDGAEATIVPAGRPEYRCRCSRDGMKGAMLVLGRAELDKLFAENPRPAVSCGFCRRSYRFGREDFAAPKIDG